MQNDKTEIPIYIFFFNSSNILLFIMAKCAAHTAHQVSQCQSLTYYFLCVIWEIFTTVCFLSSELSSLSLARYVFSVQQQQRHQHLTTTVFFFHSSYIATRAGEFCITTISFGTSAVVACSRYSRVLLIKLPCAPQHTRPLVWSHRRRNTPRNVHTQHSTHRRQQGENVKARGKMCNNLNIFACDYSAMIVDTWMLHVTGHLSSRIAFLVLFSFCAAMQYSLLCKLVMTFFCTETGYD